MMRTETSPHSRKNTLSYQSLLRRGADSAWRLLVVGAVIFLGAQGLFRLRTVVLPLVLAVFLAAVLTPVFDFLTKRGLPRSVSAAVGVGAAGSLLLVGISVVATQIAAEGGALSDNLTEGWRRLTASAASYIPGVSKYTLRATISDAVDALGGNSAELAGTLASGAASIGTVIVGALLVGVFAFFFLKDGRRLFESVLAQVDPTYAPFVRRAGLAAWETIGAYMRGLGISAAVVTTLFMLAITMIGLPMKGPLLVLAVFGSFVPFLGPAAVGVLACLVALAEGGPTDAVIVVLAGLGIQAFEGNVLQPHIFGNSLKLHPVVVIVAVSVGALLGSAAGAFLALPITASVMSVVVESRRARHSSDADTPEDEPAQ